MKTYYAYCDKNGEPVPSQKLGKFVMYPKKPTPQQLAVMKEWSGGKITQVKLFRLKALKECVISDVIPSNEKYVRLSFAPNYILTEKGRMFSIIKTGTGEKITELVPHENYSGNKTFGLILNGKPTRRVVSKLLKKYFGEIDND